MPATSSITSLIRLSVPSSTPFIRLITTASSGMCLAQCSRLARNDCDGTASTTIAASASASSGSWVAEIDVGERDTRQVVGVLVRRR